MQLSNLVTHIASISWVSALCDFVAGGLSPFFMLWANVLTKHLSVVAAIFVVVALTSGCVFFKTGSVGAECTLAGCLILMGLSFALYGETHRRDGEIRTKDLVARVEHRLAFVPASQRSHPELWLDATTDQSRLM